MKFLSAATPGLLVMLLAPSLLAQPNHHSDEHRRTITVTGRGEVQAVPDTAHINVGVVTEAKTASEALSQNNRAMSKLLDVLQQRGIAPKNIQTVSFSVSPQYRHDESGRRRPEITGYEVTNEVAVKVADLDRLGELLDEVVTAGANHINNIRFEIGETGKLSDQALRNAVTKATEKATLLADAAGVKLGDPVSISESSGTPRPVRQTDMRMAAAEAVPIAQGEQTVAATVAMTFQLQTEEN